MAGHMSLPTRREIPKIDTVPGTASDNDNEKYEEGPKLRMTWHASLLANYGIVTKPGIIYTEGTAMLGLTTSLNQERPQPLPQLGHGTA